MDDDDDGRSSTGPLASPRNDCENERSIPNNLPHSISQSGSAGTPSPNSTRNRNSTASPASRSDSPIEVGGPISLTTKSSQHNPTNFSNHIFANFSDR